MSGRDRPHVVDVTPRPTFDEHRCIVCGDWGANSGPEIPCHGRMLLVEQAIDRILCRFATWRGLALCATVGHKWAPTVRRSCIRHACRGRTFRDVAS